MNITKVTMDLTKEFKGGHPGFVPLAVQEMVTHANKNVEYTKGGDPLGNAKRVANILSNYPKLDIGSPTTVYLIYMMKHLDAILHMLSEGYEGSIEDIDSRLLDVGVYTKLIRLTHMEEVADVEATTTIG